MNLAGIGIAALVLGAVLIGVSLVVADPEPAFWPWLWARIVEVQTMVGAIVGLVGLGGVAWANAAAIRRRDDRLHEREARGLAKIVRADVLVISTAYGMILGKMDGADNDRVLRLVQMFANIRSPTMTDRAADFGEMRILPRQILDAVFPLFSKVRDVESLFAQNYVSNAPQRMRQLDDETCATLVNVFETLRDQAHNAAPILARYADTGEIPED